MIRTIAILCVGMVAALAAMFAGAQEAEAQSQSRICMNLNAQLASLNRAGGGNPAQYRKYNNAIRKQQNQLNRAVRAQRRYSCIGRLANRNNRCRQITATIQQMRGNLASLAQQREKFAPAATRNSDKRIQLQRRLFSNGCNVQEQAVAETNNRNRKRTLLEQVFGVRTYSERGGRGQFDYSPDEALFSQFNTYRTLCVRREDGYYFPISFSTTPNRLDFDETLCKSMCPNHDVGLYLHRMPHEDSEDMIAYRGGTAYRDEPFAFSYREKLNPDLQCRFAVAGLNAGVDPEATASSRGSMEANKVGTPVFRIDPTETPDAYDSRMVKFTLADALKLIDKSNQPEEIIADRDLDSQRNIRIVGPAFFPVQ